MESAAALDVLLLRGVIEPSLHRRARGLLLRVTQMLSRLAQDAEVNAALIQLGCGPTQPIPKAKMLAPR